jgi:hypothetical protein
MDAPSQKRRRRITEKKNPSIVIYSLWQQYKLHQDNTRSPASSIATPPGRKPCTSTIIARSQIIGFHPEENTRSQNNAFNKAIAKHNQ